MNACLIGKGSFRVRIGLAPQNYVLTYMSFCSAYVLDMYPYKGTKSKNAFYRISLEF